MYSFFVLGLIPGTNFQITFQVWFSIVEALVAVFVLHRLYRLQRPRLVEVVITPTRKPVPASQFHLGLMASSSTWRNLRAMIVQHRKVIIQRSVQFYQEHYPPLYEN